MRTGKAGIALIKEFEGLELKAYLCPANVWTIGYGHTAAAGPPPVRPGMTITPDEAENILRNDLVKYENAVERAVKVDLTQRQFDALVSLCYNIGPGAFAKSTLVRKLNRGEYDSVPAELMKWTKASGRELAGLVRRRRAEAKLWRELDVRPQKRGETRETPEPPTPKKTMVASKEGNAAAITGAGAGLAAANEAARTVKETADNVSGFRELLTDPTFIVLTLVVIACGAIWFWRRQRLQEE
jgi:lysozyme